MNSTRLAIVLAVGLAACGPDGATSMPTAEHEAPPPSLKSEDQLSESVLLSVQGDVRVGTFKRQIESALNRHGIRSAVVSWGGGLAVSIPKSAIHESAEILVGHGLLMPKGRSIDDYVLLTGGVRDDRYDSLVSALVAAGVAFIQDVTPEGKPCIRVLRGARREAIRALEQSGVVAVDPPQVK